MGQQVNSKLLDHNIGINVSILIFIIVPYLYKMLSFRRSR